eukprot:TRINITY_DN761_c0_g1_i1.p1 TRINITY_DN761_c0_g1~~TRINITY_DN761_c0_g1_i1.p1  ORF type:complete len:182 (-),score=49.78 TRINITY_DN761_c0_g1_i1:451-996(-)
MRTTVRRCSSPVASYASKYFGRSYATGQVLTGKNYTLKDTTGKNVVLDDLLKNKKVVIIGLPGAFTPVCSNQHVPAFKEKRDALKSAGIDNVLVVTVNDNFVCQAWEKSLNAPGISILADHDASFTKSVGQDIDLAAAGLGVRAKRYTLLVDNGKIVSENVEASPAEFKVTGPDTILAQLK